MHLLQHPPVAGNPAQEYAQAAAFLSALGALNEPCDFRAIHDRDKSVAAIPRRGTIDQLWSELCEWNNRGYGIFVTPAALDGAGRTLDNVQAIRAHYVDLDGIAAMQDAQRAVSHNPSPQMQVQSSPGRAHVYWLLDQRYRDNGHFEGIQRQLAQLYNGDPAVRDATRVMRIPGFYHLKGEPHLVTCHALPAWQHGATQAAALAASVQHVNVIDNVGGRHPLGDPELAAPSIELLTGAMADIDPNALGRDEWIKLSAAIKQAGWTLADEPTLRAIWDEWCARYNTVGDDGKPRVNDPGENQKQWTSIRETEVGWSAIVRRTSPNFRARLHGFTGQQLPVPGQGEQPLPVPAEGQGQTLDYLTGVEHTTSSAATSVLTMRKMVELQIPLAHDEFTDVVILTGAVAWDRESKFPRAWNDNDITGCKTYLESWFLKPSKETVQDVAVFIAKRNGFHPVRNYLNSLQWDGAIRLPNFLSRYFGTADNEYTRAVGMRFMISAIARIMKPGCKVDTMLILEGAQGKLKSTAFETLCGKDWFTDELPDLKNKDAAIQLLGKWIVEIAELDALNRAESSTAKKFASRSVDRYRSPYGKNAKDHPRQSVFIGSTNETQYLKDQTGNRRYWPVEIDRCDIDALKVDRNQLWAEARIRFEMGEQWWLTNAEEQLAAIEQEDRRTIDPWEDRIREKIASLDGQPVTVDNVTRWLNLGPADLKPAIYSRIANCLRAVGYARRRYREAPGGPQVWKYGPLGVD